MAASNQRIAGVVLAAGSSSRMGVNKLLLEWQGESLVRRAVRTAQAADLDPVVVVVGFDQERIIQHLADCDCRVVPNPDHAQGIHSSAAAAAAALEGEARALILMLADMPLVTRAMLQRLRDAYATRSPRLVISRYGDVIAPPTLFDRSFFPELRALQGGSARGIVERHADHAEIVDWPRSALHDIDTPADLQALRDALD